MIEDVLFEQLLFCPTLDLDTVGGTWPVYDLVFKELPSLFERFGMAGAQKGRRGLVKDDLKKWPEARLRNSDSIQGTGGNHGDFLETGKGQGQAWIIESYIWPPWGKWMRGHDKEQGWEGRRAQSELLVEKAGGVYDDEGEAGEEKPE